MEQGKGHLRLAGGRWSEPPANCALCRQRRPAPGQAYCRACLDLSLAQLANWPQQGPQNRKGRSTWPD